MRLRITRILNAWSTPTTTSASTITTRMTLAMRLRDSTSWRVRLLSASRNCSLIRLILAMAALYSVP